MFNYWPGEGKRASNSLHIGVSTGLVVSSMIISLLVCDLGAVFEIIGATSACVLAYILPPLCYIKLSTTRSRWIPAVGCIVFGSVVMVMSVVQALIKIVKSKSSSENGQFVARNCMLTSSR
jgi:solute carrier family 38 (sodium-coupled neutral amino acid transporter), member 11